MHNSLRGIGSKNTNNNNKNNGDSETEIESDTKPSANTREVNLYSWEKERE